MPNSLSWVLIDFETASKCDLKKAGAWRYSEDITTEVICIAFSHMGGEPKVWTPDMPADHPVTVELRRLAEDSSVTFVAHNAAFEKSIWRNIMVPVYGFPDIPNSRWHDTMAVCAMRQMPQDLERAALVLRLPHEKDAEGSRITRALSKPDKGGSYDRSAETLSRVTRYCIQDIQAEVALHERVGWLPQGERSVWLLDQRINERGVRLDMEFVDAAQTVADRASVPLAAEFKTITGFNVGQRDKVLKWVRDQGAQLPDMRKETLAAMLGADEETDDENDTDFDPGALVLELPDHVRRVLGIRRLIGSASIKKLRRMSLCVGMDDCVRYLLQYHGAGPGRWAGRLIQPQNFPRGSLDRKALKKMGIGVDEIVAAIKTGDPDWVEMVVGYPAVETVVSSLRNAIIPRDGRAFAVGDFSTVELRINLGLAGQQDKIDMLAEYDRTGDPKADPYNDMGAKIYKRPIERKNGDEVEGHVAKGAVLGLGFQLGHKNFRIKFAPKESPEFCEKVVKIFREEWAPKIPSNWYDLEDAALRTVWDGTPHEAKGVLYQKEDLWLSARLPSGRKLWYFNPQPCRKKMPWDETDVRRAWTYQAMKMGQFKTIDAYGGLLTENVVQALARDLMVSAMFKAEKNGMPVVLTCHDEIITEPEAKNADAKALEQIMTDVPDWAKQMRIPVAAECWAGDRYRK